MTQVVGERANTTRTLLLSNPANPGSASQTMGPSLTSRRCLYGMKNGSSLIAARHSSSDTSGFSSTHCPVCRMNDRLKRSAPTYSRRANLASNEGEMAVGPGLLYLAQK